MISKVINPENPISSLNECVGVTREAFNTAKLFGNHYPLYGAQGVSDTGLPCRGCVQLLLTAVLSCSQVYVMVDNYDAYT